MDEEEIARRAKRNLGRRKRRDEKAQAELHAKEILKAAQESAKEICRKAIEDSRKEAHEQAQAITARAKAREKDIERSIAHSNDILLGVERSIASGEERLLAMENRFGGLQGDEVRPQFGISSTPSRPEPGANTVEKMREGWRERQRMAYWKRKEDRRAQAEGSDLTLQQGGVDLPINMSQRTVRLAATSLVDHFHGKTKRFNLASKRLVLKSFWLHPALKHVHPAEFGSPKCDVAVKNSLEDTRQTLQIVKGVQRKDHLAAKRAILVAMTGKQVVSQRHQTALSKALGIKRGNLHKASRKRASLDGDLSEKFPSGEKKARSDKTSDTVRQFVQLYWETNTRVSPQKKDRARKRHGRCLYETHQIHWLEETQLEFFLRFQEGCGEETPVGFRLFQKLKPYFIRVLKDRNVCCCKYHVEMDLLRRALNQFRLHRHLPETCQCNCNACGALSLCEASKSSIRSVREWCEEILCPREEGHLWHKRACIMGMCGDCGVNRLPTCDFEMNPSNGLTVEFIAIETVKKTVAGRKDGDGKCSSKIVSRVQQVDYEKSVAEFMARVKTTMKRFVVHNFWYRWQAEEYKRCLAEFPKGTVVSSIDYSKNYSFLTQDEVQSMHWDNRQITILVHATFWHNEGCPPVLDPLTGAVGRNLVADYHFYISDDLQHDSLFVQHCLNKHAKWMKKNDIHCDRHWVWSDGCSGQFKSRRPFWFISRYHKSHGAQMLWNYHATGHGKNIVDGEGGSQKSALAREQLKGLEGHKLRNAHDAVQFLKEKFAIGKEKEYGGVQSVRRHYWEIKTDSAIQSKSWDCKTIFGCRDLHCFKGVSKTNPLLLKMRELSCFCQSCVDEDGEACPNVQYVGEWVVKTIIPVSESDARAAYGDVGPGEGLEDYDEEDGLLADNIKEGDFFAVAAEEDNDLCVDFYVLQCTRPIHIISDEYKEDAWKNIMHRGDRVLEGEWYQQYGRSQTHFVKVQSNPRSLVHAASVIHFGFALRPSGKHGKDDAYTMGGDTFESITGSLNRVSL